MPSPARLVTLGTVALAVAAGWYVVRFGADLPNTDEWDFVAATVGDRPPAAWLVLHHNEHRYPLGRLLWLTAVRTTGDFRAAMLLNVGLHTAAAALLTTAARRLRGAVSVGDLVIPALLLHWGHAFNLLMGYQVAFGLFALGLAGVAWAAVANRPQLGGLFAAVAVQSGGFGLAVAGPLAVWLIWEGPRRPAVLVWPLLLVGYCAWVVATLPRVEPVREGGTLAGAAAYLAGGLGMWTAPLGRAAWFGLGGLVLVVQLAAMRRAGLTAVLAGGLLGAAAVAYGRGELAAGTRFVTPAAVGLAVAWVALGRRAGWVGLPLAVAVVGVNAGPGLEYGRLLRGQTKAIDADLLVSELPPVFLAGRHGGSLQLLGPDSATVGLVTLRAGPAKYRRLPVMRAFKLAPADLPPTRLVCGNEPFLPGGPPPPGLSLDPPPAAIGLRVSGEQHFPMGYQLLRLRWTDTAGVAKAAEAFPKVVPGRWVVVFPLDRGATGVRLEAGCPMLGLELTSGEWLVADGG